MYSINPIFVETVPTLAPWRTPLTAALRWKFFLTGVVFPLVCFSVVAFNRGSPTLGDLWQSGETIVYIQLLLSHPSFLFFLPILSFSMACLTIWCLAPTYSTNSVVRFGIYAGSALAALFFVLLLWTTLILSPIFAVIGAILLAAIVQLAKIVLPKFRKFTILHLLIATTFVAICVALIMNVDSIQKFSLGTLGFGFVVVLGGATPLAMVTFLRVSVAACHIHSVESGISKRWPAWLFILTWLGSFATTWKFAIESVIREYEKLPPQPPQRCFVSCAAAHGHPRLVGTENEIGKTRPVNMQMRRLKLLEFALQTLAPVLHQRIRRFYNCVGPKLASVCQANRWFADLTFIVLKPVEAVAISVQTVLKISEEHIRTIYK